MDLEKLYVHLPVFLQNLAVSAQGLKINRWRYGGGFDRLLDEYIERRTIDPESLRVYQATRLREIFRSAALTPFWNERFAERGVDPGSKSPFTEIQKLPVLTKAEVKSGVDRIANRSFTRRELIGRHTSGTTGSGLVFTATRVSEQETWAVWWRYRLLHGIARHSWCGYFGGRSVVPVEQLKPPFWRTNIPGRQLMFSAYHLNERNAPFYLQCLRESKVSWLHGYPSVLSLLASYLADSPGQQIPSVRIITTGAESLSVSQRNQIESAFNARVVEHYGQAETVANISECQKGCLHVDEDFSLVEFEEMDNAPGRYRIIGTNWVNHAFPLLRYDTGDVATLDGTEHCDCGQIGRVVSLIDGRIEDYLVLPGGAKIGRLDHIFKDCVNIREAQIRQSKDGRITFCIVRGNGYGEADEMLLDKEVRKRLGAKIDFTIEYCNEIDRTESGKLRLVVSEYENN